MKIDIVSRWNGSVLFSHDCENNTLKITVEAAVSVGANLSKAYLGGAYLGGAYLGGAYLGGAYLGGAYLCGANLDGAYLDGAYLGGAYLGKAYLGGAYLGGAYLDGAYLGGANLGGAYLDDKSKLAGQRPVLQIGPIGSRGAYLVAYVVEGGIRVRAGCWFGDLAAFEKRVQDVHKRTEHGREYVAAVAMIKAHARIWKPKKAKKE